MLPESDRNGSVQWDKKSDFLKFLTILITLITILSGAVTAYALQSQEIGVIKKKVDSFDESQDECMREILSLDESYMTRRESDIIHNQIGVQLDAVNQKLTHIEEKLDRVIESR